MLDTSIFRALCRSSDKFFIANFPDVSSYCDPYRPVVGTFSDMTRDAWHVKEFLESLSTAAPATLSAYENDLEIFITWSENRELIHPRDVNQQVILEWFRSLLKQDQAPKSIARRRSTLRSYFGWLLEREFIAIDPTIGVPAPKGDSKLPRPIAQNEIQNLLDSQVQELRDANGPEKNLVLRNLIIWELLYGSGVRVGELCGLDRSSVNTSDGTLEVWGKGSKLRRVPMTPISCQLLKLWLDGGSINFDETLTPGRQDAEALFVNRRGNRVSRWDIRRVVSKSQRSPHAFRHSFATHLMNQEVDLRAVQELLGHSSLTTTQIYTHVSKKELQEAHRDFHPRG